MAGLFEEILVGNTTLKVKFQRSLKVSSITTDKFTLVKNASTPVSSPFKPIEVEFDYNSISRLLTLKYTDALTPLTDYTFTAEGLYSASGILLDPESVDFTTGEYEAPTLEEILEASNDEPPVEVEDHSIKSNVFSSSETVVSLNPDFYIIDTDPASDASIVDTDYQNGRITVKLSAYPATEFINSTYFQAHRKLVGRGFNRWEIVDAEVSLASGKPWVYIDFPSNDATPVYNTPDHEYFEQGYKYRVRVSGNIGV